MPTTEENAILAVLAKEWEFTGPPGIMDVSALVTAVELAPSDTLAALADLFVRGLVDMNPLKTSAYLTPEGYAAAKEDKR